MAKSLGELYIGGWKGTKRIGSKAYRLKNWYERKQHAEELANYVRSQGESARIISSTYKGKRVYLVFHAKKLTG